MAEKIGSTFHPFLPLIRLEVIRLEESEVLDGMTRLENPRSNERRNLLGAAPAEPLLRLIPTGSLPAPGC